MDFEEEENEPSYYAVLHIPKDATQEEVKRAYRQLAAVFHPDKHTEKDLKEGAQEAFSRLQEAYEVLSDPQRRQIYDVYGKQGLNAGLEVGEKLRSMDELKAEWEEFKKKQKKEREEALTTHKGMYMCRVHANNLGRALKGEAPLFGAIVVQNSLDVSLGDTDAVMVQGQAALRGSAGGGNMVFGYRRVLSPHDTLDANAVLGLRSVLTLSSTRQVTPYTSASATATFTLQDGMGLHLTTTRQMPHNMQGTFTWVVGPSAASGMSLSLSKRASKCILSGKLDVGAVTGISGRITYVVGEGLSLRAVARLGITGVDVEVGAARRWDGNTTGYLGTVVGLQGVAMKARFSRGGQTFEMPVILSTHYSDYKTVAAAYIVPPLLYLGISRLVVRPLAAWSKRRAAERAQAAHKEAVMGVLTAAAKEQELLAPVAKRKARAELARDRGGEVPPPSPSPSAATTPRAGVTPRADGASSSNGGGLVILEAVYGQLDQYKAKGAVLTNGGASASAPAPSSSSTTTSSSAAAASSSAPETAGATARTSTSGTASASTAPDAATAAAPTSGEGAASSSTSSSTSSVHALDPTSQWMRVTRALQYLVMDGSLVLHPGVSKSGLMGFGDPCPSAPHGSRQLYVAYLNRGTVFEIEVDDMGALVLPGSGGAGAGGGAAAGLVGQRAGGAGAGAAVPDVVAGQGAAAVGKAVGDAARVEALLRRGAEALGLEVDEMLGGNTARVGSVTPRP